MYGKYKFYLHNLIIFLVIQKKLGCKRLSLATELEELQNLRANKAELKNKLQSMEQAEKTLGVRMKVLEEKLEVRDLEEKIRAKHAVVEGLKSKIRELENRLKTETPTITTRSESEPEKMIVKTVPSGA